MRIPGTKLADSSNINEFNTSAGLFVWVPNQTTSQTRLVPAPYLPALQREISLLLQKYSSPPLLI